MARPTPREGIPYGTLDLLVLKVEEGSLYPGLQRLLLQGWAREAWGRWRAINA